MSFHTLLKPLNRESELHQPFICCCELFTPHILWFQRGDRLGLLYIKYMCAHTMKQTFFHNICVMGSHFTLRHVNSVSSEILTSYFFFFFYDSKYNMSSCGCYVFLHFWILGFFFFKYHMKTLWFRFNYLWIISILAGRIVCPDVIFTIWNFSYENNHSYSRMNLKKC